MLRARGRDEVARTAGLQKVACTRARLKFPGGHGGGVTPVPIPNTEVKPSCADDTAGVTLWESRSLPGVN